MSSLAAESRSEGCPGAPAPPGSDDATVRLLGASKRFGEITALEDATLSIRRGELMTLLGPSGCGKTTLLNLVAGFLAADRGEIEIDGKRVNDLPTYKREIGMMFQNYALFPHMSIADNVGYGLRMRGIAKPDLKRQSRRGALSREAHRRGGSPASPTFGRSTTACGAGSRACHLSEGITARRAVFRPRQEFARIHADRDQRDPAPARSDDDLRDPRSRRSFEFVRSDRRDVRGPHSPGRWPG